MAVLGDFTPLVERVSIDEAFLDVAGSVRLFGPPTAMAAAMRQRVRDEVGLPLSVGIARTKHLAKVASQVAKPDGLVVVEGGQERAFLDPLPVELLWGVGPATRARLAAAGIRTVGQLAQVQPGRLQRLLGEALGAKLGALAANVDPRRVEAPRRAVSVGAQAALGRQPPTPEVVRSTLCYLADRIAGRLRVAQRAGRTVTTRVRFADLRSVTRSVTVPVAVSATLTLTDLACDLAAVALADHPGERAISLLAISVSGLVDEVSLQLELPLGLSDSPPRPGSAPGAARWGVDRSVDAIRDRFGRHAVGYAAAALSGHERVPEPFRELAERDPARGRSEARP
jgi:DNA polymerase-4